jgi:outer membrane usher protein FimD/PapC
MRLPVQTDKQTSTGNRIYNEGTQNSAEMSSSASGASGNVGVNVAGGNGNQQDNAAAIANASSDSSLITASCSALPPPPPRSLNTAITTGLITMASRTLQHEWLR